MRIYRHRQVCKSPCLLRQHHCSYQVFVCQAGDLMLQAGFNPGLWGQLQILCQELLLAIVFFFQTLDLSSQ